MAPRITSTSPHQPSCCLRERSGIVILREEGFQPPAEFQCLELIENANIYLVRKQ